MAQLTKERIERIAKRSYQLNFDTSFPLSLEQSIAFAIEEELMLYGYPTKEEMPEGIFK